MRKTAAIAALTIRAAIRSRMLFAAVLALLTTITGLPFLMRGDGTPASQAYIFINYAFGLLMIVLSLVATWCGAGVISLEVGGHQMQILITKPLKAVQIWAGKLLGLMMVNLVLLALGGVLIYAMLQWTLSHAKPEAAGENSLRREIMTVYRIAHPQKTSFRENGPAAIAAGQHHRWRFDLAGQATPAQFALLKFRFVPSPFAYQSPVNGAWRAFTERGKDLLCITSPASPNMTIYLSVPVLCASGALNIEYLNLQTNPAVTVFFPSEELQLLLPESSFESNLLRGLLMGFTRLVLFTSLGMIAGALFTFPVAVFVSMGLLIMVLSGGIMRQLAERGLLDVIPGEQLVPIAALLNEIVRGIFKFCSAIFPPLGHFDPLAYLSGNIFIPWSLVGHSFVVLCVLYPLILMLIGAGCLSRREIGLSSS